MPPQVKILASLAFIVVVISTPITNIVAYLAYFAMISLAVTIARLPWKIVLTRSLIEIPFVLFAFLMPFFGTGTKVQVLGLSLYEEGILAGAGIIAKGTLGILAAILLSSTTTARELLRGLETLRLPSLLVQIATFMLRYMNVVNDEMERMRIARAARGFEATGLKHWRVLANSAGALFIRSYERGERVHLAMISRGYNGEMPQAESKSRFRDWVMGSVLPLSAVFTLLLTSAVGIS